MQGNLPQAMQEVGSSQWRDVGLMWMMGIGSLVAAIIWTVVLVVHAIVFLPQNTIKFMRHTFHWGRECFRTAFSDRYDYPQ